MSRAARLAELKALRAAGKKRVYEVEEAQSLYDEVDEEGYKSIVRSRLDRDDFVVGDGGEGYADDGREEWHTEKQKGYDTESEDELPTRGKAGTYCRILGRLAGTDRIHQQNENAKKIRRRQKK